MSIEVHWTSYLSALAVPVIAAFGALITYRQWRTARDKLKLDLFDRRLALYQAATAEFVRAWGYEGGTADSATDRIKLEEAKWLTSNKVAAYLEKSFRTSLEELELFHVVLEGEDPDSPEYDWDGHDERLAERQRIYDIILEKLDELFSPFLTLQH